MKWSDREASRATHEQIHQSRKASRERAAVEAAKREEEVRKALSKPTTRLFAANASGTSLVFQKAPRLMDAPYADAVDDLMMLLGKKTFDRLPGGAIVHPAVRPLEEWAPKGKSRDSLFRSLADHLLAKYAVPAFAWNVFFVGTYASECLTDLVAHIARGGSAYEFVKDPEFPIPLTRKMCHELLKVPSNIGFIEGIRLVQAQAAGMEPRIFNAWKNTRYANAILRTRADEDFWYTVVEWFGKTQMFNPSEVGPLCDYIGNRRIEDAKFSMKGRTSTALLRDMREWHRDLNGFSSIPKLVFAASGFKNGLYYHTSRDEFGHTSRDEFGKDTIREKWSVREILTSKTLHEEGRIMGHCVGSYWRMIENHSTSIWSMVMEDGRGPTGRWAMLTIEVSNSQRRVVQARARFNQAGSSTAKRMLLIWAQENNLTIGNGALR